MFQQGNIRMCLDYRALNTGTSFFLETYTLQGVWLVFSLKTWFDYMV